MGEPNPLILTYHSISETPGPTSIAPSVFAAQIAALAETGYRSMTLAEFEDWRAGAPVDRRVLITFDDAFLDFHETAHPILKSHGFSSVVFAPTACLGGAENWAGANSPPRPLMSWDQVKALADQGVEFGSHTLSHADLTAAAPDVRRREIDDSAVELEARLGRPTRSFAAPYGRVNPAALTDMRARYAVAFGTRFDRVSRSDDPIDLPRIEMFYFRNTRRWRAFLKGRTGYFHARRVLRTVREAIQGKAPEARA